jgi:aspartyl/asparaginyl-tRNA synthetase
MIEPELAFADLNDDMACATAYLQYVVGAFLYHFRLMLKSTASHICSVVLLKPLVY